MQQSCCYEPMEYIECNSLAAMSQKAANLCTRPAKQLQTMLHALLQGESATAPWRCAPLSYNRYQSTLCKAAQECKAHLGDVHSFLTTYTRALYAKQHTSVNAPWRCALLSCNAYSQQNSVGVPWRCALLSCDGCQSTLYKAEFPG